MPTAGSRRAEESQRSRKLAWRFPTKPTAAVALNWELPIACVYYALRPYVDYILVLGPKESQVCTAYDADLCGFGKFRSVFRKSVVLISRGAFSFGQLPT